MDAATIRARFRDRAFVVDESFATALQIALALEKPLLIEGPAGVGGPTVADVIAAGYAVTLRIHSIPTSRKLVRPKGLTR